MISHKNIVRRNIRSYFSSSSNFAKSNAGICPSFSIISPKALSEVAFICRKAMKRLQESHIIQKTSINFKKKLYNVT
jgi:hypothetical protein